MNEPGEPVGHGIVFKTALAVFAIVASVLHGNRDERRQLATRILRNGQIVESVAHQVELTGSVMNHENWRFGAILVGGGHIDKDLSLFSHRLVLRLKRGIVATKDLAVSQPQRELEVLPFGIPPIR